MYVIDVRVVLPNAVNTPFNSPQLIQPPSFAPHLLCHSPLALGWGTGTYTGPPAKEQGLGLGLGQGLEPGLGQGVRNLILVGDPMQLPATIISTENLRTGRGRSVRVVKSVANFLSLLVINHRFARLSSPITIAFVTYNRRFSHAGMLHIVYLRYCSTPSLIIALTLFKPRYSTVFPAGRPCSD